MTTTEIKFGNMGVQYTPQPSDHYRQCVTVSIDGFNVEGTNLPIPIDVSYQDMGQNKRMVIIGINGNEIFKEIVTVE